MNTDTVLLCICVFLMIIPMIGMGLCLLLTSPCVFSIDRRKNCCMLGKKFIWQKQYKMKTLCRLFEIKEATRKGKSFFSSYFKLCLKLKSGKDIVVFSKMAGKIGDPSDFDNWVKEINHFLYSKNEKFEIIQHKSFSELSYGILCLFIGIFCLFMILMGTKLK